MALDIEELNALLAVRTPDGVITPTAIVNAARAKGHPLHKHFCWDDTIAAEKWRCHQAREILRVLTVDITVDTHVIHAPLCVHDPTADAECYRSTDTIANTDPERARAILAYTIKIARGHLARAQNLATVFGLTTRFAGLLKDLDQIEKTLAPADSDAPASLARPVSRSRTTVDRSIRRPAASRHSASWA